MIAVLLKSYNNEIIIKATKTKKIKKLVPSKKKKLNKKGNKNVNSTSYKIKKIQTKEKFKFTWIFISDIDLKPHS